MKILQQIISQLPIQLQGDYMGFIFVVTSQSEELKATPEFRFYTENRQLENLTLEDFQQAIFVAGVHANTTTCKIIKDSLETTGVVEFNEAIQRAHRSIEDWNGEKVSLALNNKVLWEDALIGGAVIKLSGMGILKDYWTKSPTLRQEANPAFPFILFESTDEEVIVHIITETSKLLQWPAETKVMGQWPKLKSGEVVDLKEKKQVDTVEWTNFKVKDLRAFMRSRGLADNTLGTELFIVP